MSSVSSCNTSCVVPTTPPRWCGGRGRCCSLRSKSLSPRYNTRPDFNAATRASGRRDFYGVASKGYKTRSVPAASRFFPPQVAVHLVKIACERPDVLGRSLSQGDIVVAYIAWSWFILSHSK